MLDLMSGGPSPEADEALCVIADVMRRIKGDGPSMFCLAGRLSFAGAIERFRADGMGDCREIMVGTA
jgi:hypothetical protein